jgi:hypothetical protein
MKTIVLVFLSILFLGCSNSKRITSYRDVKEEIKRTEPNKFERDIKIKNAKKFFNR